jgi:hypothetical protein
MFNEGGEWKCSKIIHRKYMFWFQKQYFNFSIFQFISEIIFSHFYLESLMDSKTMFAWKIM